MYLIPLIWLVFCFFWKRPIIIKLKSSKVSAFVVYPFIFINLRSFLNPFVDGTALLEHEKVHFMQQRELLVFGAFIWGWLELFYKWVFVYKDYKEARLNLSFEREALHNQRSKHSKNRSSFNWIKYLHGEEK